MTISDEVCPIRMFKRCLPVTRYMIRRDLSKDDIPPSPTYALATRRTVGQRANMRRRFKRQPHIKLCAIRTRAEVDFSVMTFDDDPVANNQAESRA